MLRVAPLRLAAQQIARHDFARPVDVVAWLGAVQAQDWAGAKWAVGLRLPAGEATDESIEHAVDEGAIVRLHALRWTWQLVAPQNVRWMVALVAPRLREKAARRHRELGIDAATERRSLDAIARALEDGAHLTRHDLAGVLQAAGVPTTGPRVSHLLALAELDGLIGSGARRGKQGTWALLDRRAPRVPSRDRRDAIADLARIYFRSRGPATLHDFRWWSGLDPTDARAGLEATRRALATETIDGRVHHWDASVAPARAPGTHLLPPFDEYLVAYQERDAVLAPEHVKRMTGGGGMLGACIVHRGRVVGIWRRTIARHGVTVEHDFFGRPPAGVRRSVDLATARYVAFMRPQ